MKTGARKAIVTDEHREEARRLKEIWTREKRPTQAIFGETYDIGGQSAVNNYLNGTSALSMRAAKGFARGLGCNIADFSPRLAREAAELGSLMQDPPGYYAGVPVSAIAALTPVPSKGRTLDVAALQLLGQALLAAAPENRESAVAMLKTYIDNPAMNEDVLPLIVKRLSGEFVDQRPPASAVG
jgi:hypothetical protein